MILCTWNDPTRTGAQSSVSLMHWLQTKEIRVATGRLCGVYFHDRDAFLCTMSEMFQNIIMIMNKVNLLDTIKVHGRELELGVWYY